MPIPTSLLLTEADASGPVLRVRLIAETAVDDLSNPLKTWLERHGFKGSAHQICFLPDTLSAEAGCDLYLGIGGKIDPVWGLSALAEKRTGDTYCLVDLEDGLDHLALGWVLAQYDFDGYKKATVQKPLSRLIVPDGFDLTEALAVAEAAALVRDMVNTPAEDMGPAQMEAAVETVAAEYDARVSVIRGDALKEAAFPAIHAVGRAAAQSQAPRLIDMRWSGGEGPSITLVGKGVCFDTGGLNLKTGNFMRNMKKDMGGAAHVLGLAQAIMQRHLPVNLRVLIPAVENNVAGNAFRPGDILDTRAGLSVEIENTDAEGRLILGDALTYACEEKPDLLIDFATLTGAARVALGPDIPPVMTDDEAFWGHLSVAAQQTHDPVWRLPLHDAYSRFLDSKVADMRNCGDTGFAGAIVAGLYLKRFVSDDTAWAHIDVFAWNTGVRPGRPQGGEAQALRATLKAITHFLDRQ